MTKISMFAGPLAAMLLMLGNVALAEANWPQFRGPAGNGLAAADARPPVQWSETNNLAWKAALPGRGRSSPVLLGQRLWLTTALEQGVRRTRIGSDDMQTAEHVTLKALAVHAGNGKVLWETLLFEVAQPDPVHWLNSWATPTAVVEPGRVYCDFGAFGTACLDADTGAVLWKQRLPLDHQVGPGSSPVLHQNLLILVRDGRDAQYVTALDKATGKTIWKTDRPPIKTGSPNLKKSFSSPIIFQHAGRMQMAVPGPQWIAAYDPPTGRELWRAR